MVIVNMVVIRHMHNYAYLFNIINQNYDFQICKPEGKNNDASCFSAVYM